ncbi:hypothetical protein HQN84_31755 [Pedobacter steynii]|nr:M57 family metalloprotease [Pedobacter steynii]NQX43468.1 hypothetical protein [Pedobacter steynii]
MKKNNAFLEKSAFLLFAVIMIISSCKKNQVNNEIGENNKKDEKLYAVLLQNGVKAESIVSLDGYYLVEGDLLFKKNGTDLIRAAAYFQEIKENDKVIVLPRKSQVAGKVSVLRDNDHKISQWKTPGIVSSENIETISISRSSDLTSWMTAIDNAAEALASISDSKLNFYFITPNELPNSNLYTDILIRSDSNILPNDVIAAAGFPSNDKPYFEVLVNLDFLNNYSVSESQKKYNIVHEIGHCIGLRHSNWQNLGEPQIGAILIPGTPSADAGSVMNGGTALNSWNGFSSYDVVAINNLYPFSTYDKWLTSPESKYKSFASNNNFWHGTAIFVGESAEFEIKWNSNLVPTETVSLQLYQYGQFKAVIANNIPNNGSYYFNGSSIIPYQNSPRFIGQYQVKIVSDENPSITDKTSLFKLIFSE